MNKSEQAAADILNKIFGGKKVRAKVDKTDRHCKVCDIFLKRGDRFACCVELDNQYCALCDGYEYTFCYKHKYH